MAPNALTAEPSAQGKQSRVPKFLSRFVGNRRRPLRSQKALKKTPTTARLTQPTVASRSAASVNKKGVSQQSKVGIGTPVREDVMTFVVPAPAQRMDLQNPFPKVPQYSGNPPWMTKSDPSTLYNPLFPNANPNALAIRQKKISENEGGTLGSQPEAQLIPKTAPPSFAEQRRMMYKRLAKDKHRGPQPLPDMSRGLAENQSDEIDRLALIPRLQVSEAPVRSVNSSKASTLEKEFETLPFGYRAD